MQRQRPEDDRRTGASLSRRRFMAEVTGTFRRYTGPLGTLSGPIKTVALIIWILPMTPILLWVNGRLNGSRKRDDQ